MLHAQLNQRKVFFKIMRQIHFQPSFIGLLVEVYSPETVLVTFYIWCNVNHKIIRAHIAQEPDKAAFIKLDKFLTDPDLVEFGCSQPAADKLIAWQAGNMFFNQGVSIGHISDVVWGKYVFQFQTVNS